MTDESILQEAHRLVHGDRGADYGHPLDDFTKTAALFNTLRGTTLTAEDVALFMVCVKLSREANRHKRDNLVDACGYLETLTMVMEERERRGKAVVVSSPLTGEVQFIRYPSPRYPSPESESKGSDSVFSWPQAD